MSLPSDFKPLFERKT